MNFINIIIFLVSLNASAQNLLFKLDNKEFFSLTKNQMKSGHIHSQTKQINSSELKLFNVFRGYERTYQGYPFFPLLDFIYGKNWRTKRKMSFWAIDGYYQFALIPEMIKASSDKIGFVAFSEKGKNGFTLIEKHGDKVDPGPFYLVWSNYTAKDKASHAEALKWPYQMAIINVE